MAGLFKGSLAGPGYVILNVIRAINIISFLDLIAASVVMLIKISLTNSFFFFEAVTDVVTASVSIFLIVSELPVLEHYFNRHWPQLGQESSFGFLSFVMIVLGVSVLGNLNNDSYSQESVGLAFWRIIASAGILSMTMGIVNFGASFIFRDAENDVTARQVRTYGAVADKVLNSKSSHKSFQLSLSREDSLPTYRASPRPRFPVRISSPVHERHETATKSTPEPNVAFPNLAHHPAMHSDVV